MSATKNVFLTGASSGIGLETARLLIASGYSVWGTSRDVSRLPTLANFHAVTMDMTDPESIRKNFAAALEQSGHFDVLINNAGAGCFGTFFSQPDEIIREHFQVLVHGPLQLIRLALPQMRQRQSGRIINVTSLAARFPVPFLGPYNAAKAAMVSASQSLRQDLSRTPIRVIDLQPADIRTNFAAATRRYDTGLEPADRASADVVWKTLNDNMAGAPHPRIVARSILKIVTRANPAPVFTVGGFFEASVAPLLGRFGPPRLVEWCLRRYFRLG